MHIVEVTSRHRNDFHFVAYCRHCGKKSHHGDGYADAFYHQQVFPHRCCERCDLNEFGETHDQMQARFAAEQAASARVEGAR